jgi:surface antigen
MKPPAIVLFLSLTMLANAAAAAEPSPAGPPIGANFVLEDWEILRQTARLALNDRPDGEVLEWSNPESGSRGTLVALDTAEQGGRTCRSLKFEHEAGGARESEVLRFCQHPEGIWQAGSWGAVEADRGRRGRSEMFGDDPAGEGSFTVQGLADEDECARLSRSIDELKGRPQKRFTAIQIYEAECRRHGGQPFP